MNNVLLEMRDIECRFGAVVALDGVSFGLRAGTVHALLGENGAGKSTLMRIAFGMLKPRRGTIRVDGKPLQFASPSNAIAHGIGMVHQHFSLVPSMTVAENVALGGNGLFDPKRTAAEVRRVAQSAGLEVDPHAVVADLSVSAQQRCEIVKALTRDVRVLILDEPTAVLAPKESQELLHWMRTFVARDRAIVLITHKLRDALAVADDITVLRHGRLVLSRAREELDEGALSSAMIGTAGKAESVDASRVAVTGEHVIRNASAPHEQKTRAGDVPAGSTIAVDVVARLTDVSARTGAQKVEHISLDIHAGEIVGVAAIEGAGQHLLLRILAGRLNTDSGTVQLPASIGFIPEDRHRDALMLEKDLVANIALHNAGKRRGRMHWSALQEATTSLMKDFDVRAASANALARTLSGGNQQKLVAGRELSNRPRLLVADNPTRGLDFNATAAVHRALTIARSEGTGIVFYSSDLDEVLAIADRVFVMREGRVFDAPLDRAAVGHLMVTAA